MIVKSHNFIKRRDIHAFWKEQRGGAMKRITSAGKDTGRGVIWRDIVGRSEDRARNKL